MHDLAMLSRAEGESTIAELHQFVPHKSLAARTAFCLAAWYETYDRLNNAGAVRVGRSGRGAVERGRSGAGFFASGQRRQGPQTFRLQGKGGGGAGMVPEGVYTGMHG